MGLDMYFYKKSYVKNWEHTPDDKKHKVTVKMNNKVRKDIKPERITNIIEEVAYWRKFNALHNWFVQNCANGVDNCEEVYVPKETLKELLSNLKDVKTSLDASPKKTISVESGWSNGENTYMDIEVFSDTSVADELLPTQGGFFFGDTEYNKWYYNDVVETIKTFEDLLAEEPPKDAYSVDYYYQASW